LVEKLGEDGMEAIADAVDQEPATTVDTTVTSAGN
jgi:hypothetical protein